jgi:queuosine precursor transporter
MFATLLYLFAVLAANLTATLFLPVPLWPGSELLVSVGTLVFGLTFTQRDRLHRFGRPFVYRVIVLGAVLNLAMLVSFKYLWGPPLLDWLAAGGHTWLAHSAAMLIDSGWRVFAASFIGMLIAEAADTEVYHSYLDRSWLSRVLRSNAVSIPVDSIVFNLIAFAGSPFFPLVVLVKVILGEIFSKYLVGFLYALVCPQGGWRWLASRRRSLTKDSQ